MTTHPNEKAQAFDITAFMRRLCADMVARLPELSHIRLSQVAIAFSQVRKSGQYGIFASLTPLRFQHGALERIRRGRRYRVQRLLGDDGREMLYILTFYLPRFLDLDFREKLITIFHELWHISPEFNGDIRRHSGRCHVHTHSQAQYDEEMGRLADRWLAQAPAESLWGDLRYSFEELQARQGRVVGVKIARPKLFPVV